MVVVVVVMVVVMVSMMTGHWYNINCNIQVYIVFAQMASGKVFPAMFCLLPSKNQTVYKKMWTVLNQFVDSYSPTTMVLDMEYAAASSFVAIFGQAVQIIYCYFHWRLD